MKVLSVIGSIFKRGGAILINKDRVILMTLREPPFIVNKQLFIAKLKEYLEDRQ